MLHVLLAAFWFTALTTFAVLFLLLAPRERRSEDDEPGELPQAA